MQDPFLLHFFGDESYGSLCLLAWRIWTRVEGRSGFELSENKTAELKLRAKFSSRRDARLGADRMIDRTDAIRVPSRPAPAELSEEGAARLTGASKKTKGAFGCRGRRPVITGWLGFTLGGGNSGTQTGSPPGPSPGLRESLDVEQLRGWLGPAPTLVVSPRGVPLRVLGRLRARKGS